MHGATIKITDIQRIVAEYFHITPSMLQHESKKRRFAYPRQIAMYLSREMTALSLPYIGRRFGGRDHTTVIAAMKAITKHINEGDATSADLDGIRQRITDMTTDYSRGFADFVWEHGLSSMDDLRFVPAGKQSGTTANLVWHRDRDDEQPPDGWVATVVRRRTFRKFCA